MSRLFAVVMLIELCVVSLDAMSVSADDTFKITRTTEIQSTGTTEKKFVFSDTMTYKFKGVASDRRFTLTLNKYEAPESLYIPPILTSGFVMFPSRHSANIQTYTTRQVAFYKDTEGKTFLAERCDASANKGEGSCSLSGSIYYDNTRWTIESVNETHYSGAVSDGESFSNKAIIDDAISWKVGGLGSLPGPVQKDHSAVKRDVHSRHRRSVTTHCNIFEVEVIADASVWAYFQQRNSSSTAAAEAELRLHYDTLFREVDLIYSCLPDSLCLRVYLRNVQIQKNAATDWTTTTALGNVDISAGLTSCAGISFDADAPFCFTRNMLQFATIVDNIRAAATIGTTCSSEAIESGLFEDLHDGLPRLIALIIALQISNNTLICSNSASFNNTFRADDQFSNEPADVTDYSITYTFSQCAVDFLTERIGQLNSTSNNCLLSGNITDEQFLELANHRTLAGEVIDLNHQCQLAFGTDSNSCVNIDPATSTVIENPGVCGPGAFCTSNGTCGINQTIVYSGTTCGSNQICFKGVCRAIFDCGALPPAPNGFYSSLSGGLTTFGAEAKLNCFPSFETATNVTIKCRRDGWSSPGENCTAIPTTTTTPAPTTTTTTTTTTTPIPPTTPSGVFVIG